jgi:hypothetical protein
MEAVKRALARVSRYLSRDLWLATMRERVVTSSKWQLILAFYLFGYQISHLDCHVNQE